MKLTDLLNGAPRRFVTAGLFASGMLLTSCNHTGGFYSNNDSRHFENTVTKAAVEHAVSKVYPALVRIIRAL